MKIRVSEIHKNECVLTKDLVYFIFYCSLVMQKKKDQKEYFTKKNLFDETKNASPEMN